MSSLKLLSIALLINTVVLANIAQAETIRERFNIPLEVLLESGVKLNGTGDEVDLDQTYKLQFAYDINERWIVLGTLRSGEAFNSAYENVYSSTSNALSAAPHINMTHLYLRGYDVGLEGSVLELGALPTDSGIAEATALSAEGFIDGVRYQLNTPLGQVTVVGGSLSADGDINLFSRNQDLNYFEVRFNKHFLEALKSEELESQLGLQVHEGNVYVSEAIKATYQIAGKVIHVIQEGLMQDNGAYKLSGGVEFDLMHVLTGIDESELGLIMSIKHTYQSDEMGSIGGILGDSWYGNEGHSTTVEIKKTWQIGDQFYLDGYTGVKFDGDTPDVTVGIRITKHF